MNNPYDPNINLSKWQEYSNGYNQYKDRKRYSAQYVITTGHFKDDPYLMGMIDAYKRAELTTLITGK